MKNGEGPESDNTIAEQNYQCYRSGDCSTNRSYLIY